VSGGVRICCWRIVPPFEYRSCAFPYPSAPEAARHRVHLASPPVQRIGDARAHATPHAFECRRRAAVENRASTGFAADEDACCCCCCSSDRSLVSHCCADRAVICSLLSFTPLPLRSARILLPLRVPGGSARRLGLLAVFFPFFFLSGLARMAPHAHHPGRGRSHTQQHQDTHSRHHFVCCPPARLLDHGGVCPMALPLGLHRPRTNGRMVSTSQRPLRAGAVLSRLQSPRCTGMDAGTWQSYGAPL